MLTIVIDNVYYGCICDPYELLILFNESIFFLKSWNQILLSNFNLLNR
jgi:hypothetical protein